MDELHHFTLPRFPGDHHRNAVLCGFYEKAAETKIDPSFQFIALTVTVKAVCLENGPYIPLKAELGSSKLPCTTGSERK